MTAPVALVTGATEGIGRAIAEALCQGGYSVAITARTESRLREALAELTAAGHRATGFAADVSDPAAVARLVEHTERELGAIDVLINNAGIGILGPIDDMSLEEWDRVFAVNVRSLFLLCKAVLPGMRAKHQGDIVNIASLAGKNGLANGAAYSASKHAVVGFGRSLMAEVRKDGIRVVTVCPGSVDTALLRDQSVLKPNFDRILRPADVAAVVVDVLQLPRRALINEIEIRPANP